MLIISAICAAGAAAIVGGGLTFADKKWSNSATYQKRHAAATEKRYEKRFQKCYGCSYAEQLNRVVAEATGNAVAQAFNDAATVLNAEPVEQPADSAEKEETGSDDPDPHSPPCTPGQRIKLKENPLTVQKQRIASGTYVISAVLPNGTLLITKGTKKRKFTITKDQIEEWL